MYPAALLKNSTQTIDSSQVFETWILRKQPSIINKYTKSGDKKTIRDLKLVCPK